MAEPDAPIERGKQSCGPSTEPEQWGRCGPGGRVSETLALWPQPDYAEALINPIKHVSLMDQRAKQLAALIGESEVSQGRLRLTWTLGAAGGGGWRCMGGCDEG